MGSFTQGGIALGQSLGGGIENYVAGRERRELLVGKALGIQKQLLNDDKRTDEDNKYLKKFEDVNELGTRQLQSLISEFETGEELQMMGMKREILQSQVADAKAKAQSRQGLADFTSKGMPATEAGFEGDAWAVPEYLTRDYLAGDRGQKDIAAGAFPGEHYGDESKAVYDEYSVGGNPYLEETERRRAEDAEWFRSGQVEPPSAGPTDPSQGYNLQGLTNLGIVDANGNVQFSQKKYDDMFSPAALDETKRQSDNNYYRKKLDETIETIADMEGRSKTPSRDFAWYNKELENKDMYGRLIESTNQQQAPSSMPTEENPWPQAQAGEEGLDPVVVPNTMADVSSLQPEAVEPEQTQQRLAGYETHGDGDGTPQAQLSDRMATGGTPATPVDERRGQLIDSLARYNLTPTDRKQAIDMISEKYPKLKEFATEVITAGGEEIGYKVGGTFVKKAKGRVATPQGWRVKSRSVNQSTGEETVVFEDPTKLPSYVPTAKSRADADPELTLKEENAPDGAQAKAFNEASASSKGLIEDTRWMIEQTKKAGAIEQRMHPTFKAGIQTRLVAMRAQMRKVVVGTGSVSEFEQQMLRDAIPDSSDIFRWDSATIKRLESLGGMSERHVKYQGESIGLWDYKPIGAGGQSGVGGTTDDPLGKFSK